VSWFAVVDPHTIRCAGSSSAGVGETASSGTGASARRSSTAAARRRVTGHLAPRRGGRARGRRGDDLHVRPDRLGPCRSTPAS
jgi:hypothetical protein